MTRDEVQTVIDGYKEQANRLRVSLVARKQHDIRVWFKHDDSVSDAEEYRTTATAAALDFAARMLTEALEKSEAGTPTDAAVPPLRLKVRLPRADAIARGIDYGSEWGTTPREFPEAGRGLWRCTGLWSDGGTTCSRWSR